MAWYGMALVGRTHCNGHTCKSFISFSFKLAACIYTFPAKMGHCGYFLLSLPVSMTGTKGLGIKCLGEARQIFAYTLFLSLISNVTTKQHKDKRMYGRELPYYA